MATVDYDLVIKDLHPSTTPMARLALYIEELAKLLGEKDYVFLSGIREGSLAITSSVDERVSNIVLERLKNPSIKRDAQAAYTKIQAMLAEDNTSATISQNGNNLLHLQPKKNSAPQKSPREVVSVRGTLISIGGRDETIPFTLIEKSTGNTIKGNTSKEIAKELAHQLFNSVEVTGVGSWRRSDGKNHWELTDFKVTSFVALKSIPVRQVIDVLYEKSKPNATNPLDLLKQIRED